MAVALHCRSQEMVLVDIPTDEPGQSSLDTEAPVPQLPTTGTMKTEKPTAPVAPRLRQNVAPRRVAVSLQELRPGGNTAAPPENKRVTRSSSGSSTHSRVSGASFRTTTSTGDSCRKCKQEAVLKATAVQFFLVHQFFLVLLVFHQSCYLLGGGPASRGV